MWLPPDYNDCRLAGQYWVVVITHARTLDTIITRLIDHCRSLHVSTVLTAVFGGILGVEHYYDRYQLLV